MTQANGALTAIRPSPATAQAVIFIPEIHSKTGNELAGLRTGDATKATIVADIASSQHEDVVRVLALDLASGKCWDASKEIAQAVLDSVIAEYGYVPRHCLDFCEDILGVNTVQRCQREAA